MMSNNDRIWIAAAFCAVIFWIFATQVSSTIAEVVVYVLGLVMFFIAARYWGKSIKHG